MKRLIYTLQRMQRAFAPRSARELRDDALLGITMAGLGLPRILRHVDSVADTAQATITFPDDTTLQRFNLRIERALSVRGVRISKISVAPERAHGAVPAALPDLPPALARA